MRFEQRLLPASSSQVVTTAGATFSAPTCAVLANATGNLIGQLERDSGLVTIPVVDGTWYDLAFIAIDATTAVGCIALFNTL